MKILVLTPLPSPFVEQAYRHIEKAFNDLRVVPVFYGTLSHRPSWGKLNWEGYWLKGSIRKRIATLKKIVQDETPDRVVLGQYNRIESWWLKFYAKRNNLPSYIFFLEPVIPCSNLKYWFKLKLSGYFFAGVQVIGVMGRRAQADYGRVYDGRIIECPYTFDLSGMLSFGDEHRDRSRVTFLYSGRLTPFRDPIRTVDAFAGAKKRCDAPMHLVISGGGELKSAVEQRIAFHGIEDSVSWMNDFEDWEDLRNLYRHADILVSVGIYNTWSLTIPEAMAAGMGVIATHTTEAANTLILNEYNGFLIHHADLKSIEDAIIKYAKNPELHRLHAKRNREAVKVVDLKPVAERIAHAMELL